MASQNVELVRSICTAWARGEFGGVEWAHPEIEYVQAGQGPAPGTWTGVAGMAEGWRDFMERFRPAYRAELEGFLRSVRDGTPSLCGGEDARRALVVALAADRSRSERRPVAVAEVG